MSVSAREGQLYRTGDVLTPVGSVGPDGAYHPINTSGSQPDQFDLSELVISSAGGAASKVWPAAGPSKANAIDGFVFSYSDIPTGGALTILDGTDTVFQIDILDSGPGEVIFPAGKYGHANRTMTATLAAGGGSVVAKLNALNHYTLTVPVGGTGGFNDPNNGSIIPLLF